MGIAEHVTEECDETRRKQDVSIAMFHYQIQ